MMTSILKMLDGLLDLDNLKGLVKEETCFKSLNNPTCTDLFLTNNSKSYHHTSVISSSLSDRHKLIVTVLNTTFKKCKPNVINYRSYKQSDNSNFRMDLRDKLRNFSEHDTQYDSFHEIFLKILNDHAPLTKKIVRANEVPYMIKALRKAIVTKMTFKK